MHLQKLLFFFIILILFITAFPQYTKAQIYFGGDEQLKVTDLNGLNPTVFLDEEITGLAIDTTKGILFFSNRSSFFNGIVEKISLDGTGRQEILDDGNLGVNNIIPRGIALDQGNMVVYIADLLNDGRILSVNYDGTNPQIIIAGEADGVTTGILDVAVDTVNNKLYWPKLNAIMRSDLDGNNVEMIAEVDPIPGQEDNPVQVSVIQVDPVGGKVYWADPSKDQITIADLDGSNKQVLIETSRSPEGLHLDLANQRLFYLDDARFRGEATAYFADLDGSNVTKIATYSTPTTSTGPIVVNKFEMATSLETITEELPIQLQLNQNYPNPFNPTTQINFNLPRQGFVNLSIYNSLGQEIAVLVGGEMLAAGSYSYSFDGSNLASGIYYYRLEANGTSLIRSMTLLK